VLTENTEALLLFGLCHDITSRLYRCRIPSSCRPQRVNTSRGRASSGRNGASRGNLFAVLLDSRYMSETSKGDERFGGWDKGEKRNPWRMTRVGEREVYLALPSSDGDNF